ncbi:hypothetical protein [Saccharothrix xinjiangensis]|uniref:Uncharacterized protein n=1 Tax=Saccharothrix xinjiangensis TaxID=204798 RepID=A0ABV9Y9W7_9PSEU
MNFLTKRLRPVLAGLAAAVVATMAFSPSASAEDRYTMRIIHDGYYVADFCLLSQAYGANKPVRAQCSGNKGANADFTISVPLGVGDRVWLDMNVVAGRDVKGITVHNGHIQNLGRHGYNFKTCLAQGLVNSYDIFCNRDGEQPVRFH